MSIVITLNDEIYLDIHNKNESRKRLSSFLAICAQLFYTNYVFHQLLLALDVALSLDHDPLGLGRTCSVQ